jgi:hypothetical protein
MAKKGITTERYKRFENLITGSAVEVEEYFESIIGWPFDWFNAQYMEVGDKSIDLTGAYTLVKKDIDHYLLIGLTQETIDKEGHPLENEKARH